MPSNLNASYWFCYPLTEASIELLYDDQILSQTVPTNLKVATWKSITMLTSSYTSQVYFCRMLPKLEGILISEDKNCLRFITLTQFLLRVVMAYPLFIQIADVSGVISRKA